MAWISSEFLSYLVPIVKWSLVVILAANWEAIPLVWHLRVFWSPAVWLAKQLPLFPRAKRAYMYARMPIGENPFDYTYTFKTAVGASDADYNLNLSHSAYGKNFDYARMRAFVHWFPSLLSHGLRLGLGASHYHFIREIPIGTRYYIQVNIVAWEEKWIHLVAQFVTYPDGHGEEAGIRKAGRIATNSLLARASKRLSSKASRSRAEYGVQVQAPLSPPKSSFASDAEDDDLFERPSRRSTPLSSVGSTSPEARFGLSLDKGGLAAASDSLFDAEDDLDDFDLKGLPALPEGAVLHCVHVSTYCFKQGRITVPPRVALVAAGFGDPSVGRAARVKQITDTLSHPKMSRSDGTSSSTDTCTIPDLMRSEWKRYEAEGLWELPEYEERNRAGVARHRPLRLTLDNLRF